MDADKTLFILRYLQDPAYRKRVGRQLNKGESVNALRDTVLAFERASRSKRPAARTRKTGDPGHPE